VIVLKGEFDVPELEWVGKPRLNATNDIMLTVILNDIYIKSKISNDILKFHVLHILHSICIQFNIIIISFSSLIYYFIKIDSNITSKYYPLYVGFDIEAVDSRISRMEKFLSVFRSELHNG
jgi:hypothetical protein